MSYIYYIDGKKVTTDNLNKIPWNDVSSLDENTPALENLKTGFKVWCLKGLILHRLTGPAYIRSNGKIQFWLNDYFYDSIHKWLFDNPNQDNAFQVEMILKYT
jgi:hypothetical protein